MRKVSIYDYYEDGELIHESKTIDELSELTGFTSASLRNFNSMVFSKNFIKKVGRAEEKLELYDVDGRLIASGIMKDIVHGTGYSEVYLTKIKGKKRSSGNFLKRTGEIVRVKHGLDRKAFKRAQVEEVEQKKKIKYRKAKPEKWRPSHHTGYLFYKTFERWEEVEC